MKVLFISSWYPNSVNPLKGVFVKKHAAAIKAAGVDIQVLAITVSPSLNTFEKKIYRNTDEHGIVTHQIELNSRFYKWIHLNLFFQYRVISGYIDKILIPEFKPDIVHSNVLYPAGLLGYKISKHYKLPHIITEHWSKVDKFMKSSLFSYLGKKAYNNASAITVVSNYLKENISKHVSNDSIIRVIPNVVNTDIFKYSEKPGTHEGLTFSCVAHWTAPKRPDLIFNALQQFAETIEKKITLNVIGEGVLIQELKGIKWNFSVNYLGNLKPEDLAKVLQNSDYFLHASDIETFSIVIAEALSTGIPVLASNVGAIPELINETNGLVCNNQLQDWVNSLNVLVKNKSFDHKKISETSNKYSLAQIGKEFKSLYEK